VADLLFATIELFSLDVTVETLKAIIDQSRRFSERVGHFERKFQVEGDVAPNHFWYFCYLTVKTA